MKLFFSLFLILTISAQTHAGNVETAEQECVVLLHGLARGPGSMTRLEKALTKDGYLVVNQKYPSRKLTISELSQFAVDTGVDRCGDASHIHFVTHSLGGILVRDYLSRHQIDRLGRVVMLGPPNAGSEAVDAYKRWPGVAAFGGPAFLQLASDPDHSYPKSLGPVTFKLGVIAGDRSINPILSVIIPGKDDGKVSVCSSMVDGMKDHVVVHTNHFMMLRNADVIRLARRYLRTGRFEERPVKLQRSLSI